MSVKSTQWGDVVKPFVNPGARLLLSTNNLQFGRMSFMDNASIRRENLRTLKRELGSREVLDRLDMTKQLLSQYIGKNPKKQIGDELARRVEVAFGKEYGWMDHLHGQYGKAVQDIVDFAMSLPPEQLTPLLTFLKGAAMFVASSQESNKNEEE